MGEFMQPEQEQIMRYAEAFYGLAELFGKLPCQRERLGNEELQSLFGDIKERVCTGCRQEEHCWGDAYFENCRSWYELLREMERDGDLAVKGKDRSGDGDFCGRQGQELSGTAHGRQEKGLSGAACGRQGQELSGTAHGRQEQKLSGAACGRQGRERRRDACERQEQLLLALRAGYEEARLNLLWSNRMLEQRQAAGEQIFQTARLLQKTSENFARKQDREWQIGKRLRRELRFLDVEMDAVRVFMREEQEMEVYLTLHSRKREPGFGRRIAVPSGRPRTPAHGGGFGTAFFGRPAVVSAKAVAEALSECCGERMCPALDCRACVPEEPALFHFVPDTNYQFFCGLARITKDGELVSGDNYSLSQKDNGRVVMSLADGMGSGMEANRASEKVIELLEQFLCAGFPQETAVRIINSGMLLQNCSPVFSTIDLCMVDLYNATCDMMKSGAAASFIRKNREIEVIRSGSFPAGVMQRTDYESMHRKLESGANIVMMTDGVLDAIPGEEREQTMAELIIRTMTRNAQEHARRLMERVYLMQRQQARDDMTLLVGTIWEK
ncbi:MAG: SpoIIE family protein phosphatase [Lachnospiraceae bacterium]|nr:SpoIIE family protein phosphatase [Lachnospiraceae bacterium]